MINNVYLLGHLGQPPELKRTKAGRRYAMLSLATSKRWREKDGTRKERTDWHRIVVWREQLVDLVEKYCEKGSKLWLEGELAQRSWTDEAGKKHWVTEVVVSGFGGNIQLFDKRKGGGVPEPEDEDAYEGVSEMERSYA